MRGRSFGLNDETVRAFRPPDVSGTLRIGTSDDYAQAFLPPILMQFAQTHRAVEIAVVTGDAVALRQRARNEHFDALLISDGDPGAGAEPLRTDRLHWLGSERFCRHLDDRLPLALWSDGCTWRAKALAALEAGGRDWRLAYTTSNAPLLIATVRDGLGITVAPRWYLSKGLKVLEDMDARYPLGEATIFIQIPKRPEPPALTAFLDYLKAHFRPEVTLNSQRRLNALTGQTSRNSNAASFNQIALVSLPTSRVCCLGVKKMRLRLLVLAVFLALATPVAAASSQSVLVTHRYFGPENVCPFRHFHQLHLGRLDGPAKTTGRRPARSSRPACMPNTIPRSIMARQCRSRSSFTAGYAIHGTTELSRLGTPASHGCVRLDPQECRKNCSPWSKNTAPRTPKSS